MVRVEGATEPILSVDLQASDLSWFGDRLGERAERTGLIQGSVGAMTVVERFELAEHVQQVSLVPYEGAVE